MKASANPNLSYLILDNENDKPVFIHAKIYLIDKKYAVSGSANLTFSGFNTNVETLSIAETEREVLQIERDFMHLWLKYERLSIGKEQLSSGNAHSIENALPLSTIIEWQKNVKLTFFPYFFFEYILRGSIRNPPMVVEDRGLFAIYGGDRQVISDPRLVNEINNKQPTNYVIHTDDKYTLQTVSPIIAHFKEASEIALDFIIRKNTREYFQHYGSRSYKRLYVPRKYEISFLKNYFVNVPIWTYETSLSDGLKHYRTVFGSSGVVWSDNVSCPICQRVLSLSELIPCSECGRVACQHCNQEKGLIFKKRLCPSCYRP